jgi:hypothetical protein
MWHLSLTVGGAAEGGGIIDALDLDRHVNRPAVLAGEM